VTRFRGTLAPPFPPALHAEIGLANRRALELASRDRELHFTSDADGRVVVELRTLGGRLLGTIPAARALDIINGADLDEVLRIAKSESPSPPRPPAEA
jgi:hypothetical protein